MVSRGHRVFRWLQDEGLSPSPSLPEREIGRHQNFHVHEQAHASQHRIPGFGYHIAWLLSPPKKNLVVLSQSLVRYFGCSTFHKLHKLHSSLNSDASRKAVHGGLRAIRTNQFAPSAAFRHIRGISISRRIPMAAQNSGDVSLGPTSVKYQRVKIRCRTTSFPV